MPSMSSIKININIPPFNCEFNVEPSLGYALYTNYTLKV